MSEMREPTFLILTSLADGQRRHGYAIMTDVAKMTSARVRLTAGTLYTALERLRGDDLVDRAGSQIVHGRRRQYYTLTELGASALIDEVDKLRLYASVAAKALRARA